MTAAYLGNDEYAEEEPEDEGLEGEEAPCDKCGQTHRTLFHRWNENDGDLWLCDYCK